HYCYACGNYAPEGYGDRGAKICPTCRGILSYVAQYDRQYCYRCNAYPADDAVIQSLEATMPVDVRPAPETIEPAVVVTEPETTEPAEKPVEVERKVDIEKAVEPVATADEAPGATGIARRTGRDRAHRRGREGILADCERDIRSPFRRGGTGNRRADSGLPTGGHR